jgi:putative ABC transport system permease protein
MLKLINVVKDYKLVGGMEVHALKGVSVNFRRNEFVSVLGPSGCGKTTLLNIIGGLDKFDSGDLIINGRSTANFKDKDWDVYRNHRVGFIFQSYNLIPHQSVLENVELSLTIAGLSKAQRVEMAKKALDQVGLENEYSKKPNQLSGGQQQRVSIARALVNNPEILLADEPTGALDTVTSKQIMDLVKDIAKDRLVIMVTHNPELAEEYSTRIIHLLDGKLISDSNPYVENIQEIDTVPDVVEKAKMSFGTAFKLSLKNLISKKKRTVLTAIAGSIGIIGVSCVLSMSYGVQSYIKNMQDDMLSGNPITIAESGFDLAALMDQTGNFEKAKVVIENDFINVNAMIESISKRMNTMESVMYSNEITQTYIDYLKAMPKADLAAIFLNYGVDISNSIYTDFSYDGTNATTENTSLSSILQKYTSVLENEPEYSQYSTFISMLGASFNEAPDSPDYILSQYDLLEGKIAEGKNEIMIVVDSDQELTDLLLAQLGYYSQKEFLNMIYKVTPNADGTPNPDYEPNLDKKKFSYDELLGKEFTWYPNDTIFTDVGATSFNPYFYKSLSNGFLSTNSVDLNVVGILRPNKGLQFGSLSSGFYYTQALTKYAIDINIDSKIVKTLLDDLEIVDNPETPDVVEAPSYNGSYSSLAWSMEGPDGNPIVQNIGITYKFSYRDTKGIVHSDNTGFVGQTSQMGELLSMFTGGMGFSVAKTYSLSIRQLAGDKVPNAVSIYPANFELKKNVNKYLDAWNGFDDITFVNESGQTITVLRTERSNIKYSDTIEIIINMINTMINIITVALVGFTSLALVVSCVMIAIITYVSVIERIKEIGVIRSLGGRKSDISNLFNSETFMIGLSSGVIGVIFTYVFSLVVNVVVHQFNASITAISIFPIHYAAIMLGLSILLSVVSGLIPALHSAKLDPVTALRSE